MVSPTKKIATKTENGKTIRVCLKYDHQDKQGDPVCKATIGGENFIQSELWNDIYTYAFNECDGEPYFYSITAGKVRLTFRSTFKNYESAIDKLVADGYEIKDVTSFQRLM